MQMEKFKITKHFCLVFRCGSLPHSKSRTGEISRDEGKQGNQLIPIPASNYKLSCKEFSLICQ